MRKTIAQIVNVREFANTKPLVLLEMVYDDLVRLLRFIHRSQRSGSLKEPFYFTNRISYLDEMWHHFILQTRSYHEFCNKEFGEYLHHEVSLPSNAGTGESIGSERIITSQMALLEAHLGADFIHRILFIYPELLKREENV
ncbi:hypothetical protein BDW_06210 [Bdellovibrio bacteriovorus W]|nr:hypothetical protein BDW_06210 [Bdellovibrio bacteriovorus W]